MLCATAPMWRTPLRYPTFTSNIGLSSVTNDQTLDLWVSIRLNTDLMASPFSSGLDCRAQQGAKTGSV